VDAPEVDRSCASADGGRLRSTQAVLVTCGCRDRAMCCVKASIYMEWNVKWNVDKEVRVIMIVDASPSKRDMDPLLQMYGTDASWRLNAVA
jgi:hypothetical protein